MAARTAGIVVIGNDEIVVVVALVGFVGVQSLAL